MRVEVRKLGVHVCLVTDYKQHLNPCIKREIHGFTSAAKIRESLN
jgi:hypothetical protein